ncbi:MAG: GTP-binding protein [Actinomycetia bacterium]|nr:GTP-binding protein [Actinomycetes bacterium]MCP4228461.1 GTP-binding protein [Actinomycetes bacterium]MCP5031842.1 GTP-binding protein [Actinomycetes bacterium]
MTNDLIPVTVIGGYLGAGKTTLLNRLLAGDHGRRLAVLVNDFGPVNIDADLITAHDGDTISLRNGCVCCSISDALGDALDRVIDLNPLPDQIVIEASGVADPARIAHYGQGWPGCRLDAVVVLADVETIRARARDEFVGELVTRQLRGGDLVVVTKVDLVDGETMARVVGWVEEVAGSGSTVLTASEGRVDPLLVLDPAPGRQYQPAPIGEAEPGDPAEELFESALIELDSPVERDRMTAALERWPEGVVRVKGIVTLAEDGAQHMVQRVGRRWSIEPVDQPPERHSPDRLLVIGLQGRVDLAHLTTEIVHLVPEDEDRDQRPEGG